MKKGLLFSPKASVTKRAGFIKNHLWITEYNPSQLYAAGKYPNQHPGGDGLELWTSEKKSVINKDIVLWYSNSYSNLTFFNIIVFSKGTP